MIRRSWVAPRSLRRVRLDFYGRVDRHAGRTAVKSEECPYPGGQQKPPRGCVWQRSPHGKTSGGNGGGLRDTLGKS